MREKYRERSQVTYGLSKKYCLG